MPSIGFASRSCSIRRRIASDVASSSGRQELVQRRVEQPDRHREARPSPRRSPRSRPAAPAAAGRARRGAPRSSAARIISCTIGQPVRRHEHVLGAAEADALGAELARLGGVLGRVGVRAHAQPAELVRPAEDRLEVLVDRGRDERHRADDHPARAAVDREQVALAQLVRRRCVTRPRRRRRSRAPRSRRRTACPSRARRPPRARSSRRAPSGRPARGSGRGCRRASSPSGRGRTSSPGACRAPRRGRRRARSPRTRRPVRR